MGTPCPDCGGGSWPALRSALEKPALCRSSKAPDGPHLTKPPVRVLTSVTAGFAFLIQLPIEIRFTYHKIHPFKAYSPVCFSISRSCETITIGTFQHPEENPSPGSPALLSSTSLVPVCCLWALVSREVEGAKRFKKTAWPNNIKSRTLCPLVYFFLHEWGKECCGGRELPGNEWGMALGLWRSGWGWEWGGGGEGLRLSQGGWLGEGAS